MHQLPQQELLIRIQNELLALDEQSIELDGKQIKPSQCYRVGISPAHILFNTNCPDSVKQKVQAILSKYTTEDENRSQ